MPLKLILAHCGAGPDANRLGSRATPFKGFLPTYERWLDVLLADYPNVYFDLAGMQVNGDVESLYISDSATNDPTPFGDLLIRKISAHPTRFLVGTDILSTDTADIATWAASYASYVTFLNLAALSDGTTIAASDQELVLSANWSSILADVYP